jgi:hypothetical protein
MKTSKFQFATISTGSYNTAGYSKKEYSTLVGFKKGLKANNCPFEVDDDGLFADVDNRLKRRQWNYAGQQFTATVEIE